MNPPTPKRDMFGRKAHLAKLLATENLIVVNDPAAHTASFNVDKRILSLPLWEKASDELYTMLTAHEVGHALITPRMEVIEPVCNRVCPNNPSAFFPYLNVVEDIRVDATMKKKYPGIRRDYFAAHSELISMNFFGVDLKGDLSTLPLAERLNIQAKVGIYNPVGVCIPFSPEEQIIVNEAFAAQTFEEVCAVAEKIFVSANDPQSQTQQSSPVAVDSHEENPNGMMDNGSLSTLLDRLNGSKALAKLSNPDNANTNMTVNTLPKGLMEADKADSTLNGFVYPFSSVTKDANEMRRIVQTNPSLSSGLHSSGLLLPVETYRKIEENNRAVVAGLVSQFEQRKAADEAKRTRTGKTGRLDMRKIHSYRFNEDIFLRSQILPKGKNHGMVFFLDWSSSMSTYLEETVEQLLVLCSFCRRMKIPFEVYAFSDAFSAAPSSFPARWRSTDQKIIDASMTEGFRLVHVLTSSLTDREYRHAAENLCMITLTQRLYELQFAITAHMSEAYCYRLCSTPLNEAILCAMKIVPLFQEKHGCQIVNTIFLTDGHASCSVIHRGYSGLGVLALPNGKQIKIHGFVEGESRYNNNYDETNSLAIAFREFTGSNLIRFHITNTVQYATAKVKDKASDFRKNGYVVNDDSGFSREFYIRSSALGEESDILQTQSSGIGNIGDIRKAFLKDAKSRKTSRSFLMRFAEIIAGQAKRLEKEVA